MDEPRLKEFLCQFCASDATMLIARSTRGIHKTFRCFKCNTTTYIPSPIAKDENLSLVPRSLRKKIPVFEPIIKNCTQSNYSGSYLCPICLFKLGALKACKRTSIKKAQYYRWQCQNCFSNGFVTEDVLPKWRFISSILQFK